MLLEAIHVSAGYPRHPVLTDVSVSVEPGAVVGLLGPNGSGKSTLLRVLSGVLAPSAGTVTLAGAPLSKIPRRSVARQIAFVPQQENPAFDFTVQDVVMMGRYAHTAGRHGPDTGDFEAVRKAMEEADVQALAKRLVSHLSGGEMRRVLVARALAQEPSILMMDEPTAHLDVTHQLSLMALTRDLAIKRNMAVIIALHDMSQAVQICDSVRLLHHGKLVAVGAPLDVVTSRAARLAFGAGFVLSSTSAGEAAHVVTVAAGGSALMELPPGVKAVHVIGGAGTAQQTLQELKHSGADVSTGILQDNDIDCLAARAMAVEVVCEPAFHPVSARARQECARLMALADVIVLCPAPFGPLNVANLELAADAQNAGTLIVVLGNAHSHAAYPPAQSLIETMISRGAVCAQDVGSGLELAGKARNGSESRASGPGAPARETAEA